MRRAAARRAQTKWRASVPKARRPARRRQCIDVTFTVRNYGRSFNPQDPNNIANVYGERILDPARPSEATQLAVSTYNWDTTEAVEPETWRVDDDDPPSNGDSLDY